MASLMPEGKQSFTDAAGIPLVGGKVYTYDAGTNTHRVTYSDADQTTPNTNPVVLDARGEATIFWSGNYKIILKDVDDNTIWTVDDAEDTASLAGGPANVLRADLINTADNAKGDALLGVKQPLTGAVARTQHDKNQEFVSVKDFGAVGDGVTNDRSAIQAAFNASKSVEFPDGSYYLGTASTAENMIDLSALGDNITIKCGPSVELVMQTTSSVMPRIFYLLNNSNFHCDPIRMRDTGYDSTLTWKGAIGFYMDCSTSASWSNINIEAIYAKNLVAPVQVTGGDAVDRIRGIKIGMLYSDDCYYGFNALNNGDGVAIDNLVAVQNFRPYFVYGAVDHKVKIYNRNARSASGAVNISRSVGGFNTSGIDVTYVARDMSVNITHVLINHIDLLGGEISNIRLNLDIRSSVIYTPIRFVNYTGSGGSETSAASLNNVYDVYLAGSCDAQANPVTSVAAYASKRQMTFVSGTNFFYDTTIPALFSLNRQGRSQAVTWTASVNPSIGDGSLSGSYDLVNGLCNYSVALTVGATTTFGTGDWSFSAPFAATTEAVGSVWVLDSGTTFYVGVCKIINGTTTVNCYTNAASGFRSTVPMTWAPGDQLQLTITYPVS